MSVELSDLRLPFKCVDCDSDRHWREHWKEPSESEILSALTTEGMIRELVERGVLTEKVETLTLMDGSGNTADRRTKRHYESEWQ